MRVLVHRARWYVMAQVVARENKTWTCMERGGKREKGKKSARYDGRTQQPVCKLTHFYICLIHNTCWATPCVPGLPGEPLKVKTTLLQFCRPCFSSSLYLWLIKVFLSLDVLQNFVYILHYIIVISFYKFQIKLSTMLQIHFNFLML